LVEPLQYPAFHDNAACLSDSVALRSDRSDWFGYDMRKWQMQQAKAKFAEVVKRAASEGPQIVTYRGADAAVVLSMDEYHRLEAKRPSLVDYLMSGPKLDDETVDEINNRSTDTGREIEF
jgi:prevent-host-death family protein